ncbi:hypothetical protein AVEN_108258-1 [Araneus ventricosus]|uniref:Uncharacterized protein n=1 Tax=Araneus ventricosus TaxID=182803 RepID=A0A4Y2DXL1_ARAVE|nr:hypothetical protein AVEN_108258-1 [Araneus ventricosus]
MASPLLQSLLDSCCIRIAYLMWTRRDVTKKCKKEVLFDELVDFVLDDVESLPLPKQLKSRILKHVKPVGKHLLSLVNLWLANKLPENSQKWLTSDMLSECLILKADGLINQRKTAEKLLSSRMLHYVFAFRLACMNFLEKEVLKLWILVKEYFLNRIMLEGEQANAIIAQNGRTFDGTDIYVDLTDHYYSYYIREYPNWENSSDSQPFPFTAEPYEVLFWIGFCLSKENAVGLEEMPHFLGDYFDWYEFALEFAAFSGNVACFDYLKNFRSIEYSNAYIIKRNFSSKAEDRKQPCFVFNFLPLNSEEKAELFRKYEAETLTQFLQWPLTLMFVENPEGLWNLMSDFQKSVIFREIFDILFNENILLHTFRHRDCHIFSLDCLPIIPGMHNLDHLARLFIALWEISSYENKLFFLNSWIFKIIESSRGQQEFLINFVTTGLRDKLFQLFLSNGEAVLELFERENMKESLRSLVAKHMPQHFEELDRRCISFIEEQTVRPEIIRREMVKARDRILILSERKTSLSNIVYPSHENFLNYIKNVLFSSNRN